MYTGAGAQVPGHIKSRLSRGTPGADGRVSFGPTPYDYSPGVVDSISEVRLVLWSPDSNYIDNIFILLDSHFLPLTHSFLTCSHLFFCTNP